MLPKRKHVAFKENGDKEREKKNQVFASRRKSKMFKKINLCSAKQLRLKIVSKF